MAFPGLIKRSNSTKKNSAKPGSHPSKVVKVSDADGYAKGEAFWLWYELENDGKMVEYSEFFLNDTANDRTGELDEYLKEHGVIINSPEELIGLQEVLTLEKQVRNGKSYLNVANRKFVSWKEADCS